MHATEFALVLLWVLVPPLVLGIALLVAFSVRNRRSGKRRLWSAAFLLIVFAFAFSLAFVAFGPAWLGRHIGIRDIQVFGAQTMWAPFAFISIALAFPFAAWWAKGGRGDES
jgi:hypothetical protein